MQSLERIGPMLAGGALLSAAAPRPPTVTSFLVPSLTLVASLTPRIFIRAFSPCRYTGNILERAVAVNPLSPLSFIYVDYNYVSEMHDQTFRAPPDGRVALDACVYHRSTVAKDVGGGSLGGFSWAETFVLTANIDGSSPDAPLANGAAGSAIWKVATDSDAWTTLAELGSDADAMWVSVIDNSIYLDPKARTASPSHRASPNTNPSSGGGTAAASAAAASATLPATSSAAPQLGADAAVSTPAVASASATPLSAGAAAAVALGAVAMLGCGACFAAAAWRYRRLLLLATARRRRQIEAAPASAGDAAALDRAAVDDDDDGGDGDGGDGDADVHERDGDGSGAAAAAEELRRRRSALAAAVLVAAAADARALDDAAQLTALGGALAVGRMAASLLAGGSPGIQQPEREGRAGAVESVLFELEAALLRAAETVEFGTALVAGYASEESAFEAAHATAAAPEDYSQRQLSCSSRGATAAVRHGVVLRSAAACQLPAPQRAVASSSSSWPARLAAVELDMSTRMTPAVLRQVLVAALACARALVATDDGDGDGGGDTDGVLQQRTTLQQRRASGDMDNGISVSCEDGGVTSAEVAVPLVSVSSSVPAAAARAHAAAAASTSSAVTATLSGGGLAAARRRRSGDGVGQAKKVASPIALPRHVLQAIVAAALKSAAEFGGDIGERTIAGAADAPPSAAAGVEAPPPHSDGRCGAARARECSLQQRC